jgi:F-type H+-transporting ATPase subunit delta
MAKIDDRELGVARIYAEAMLELAEAQGEGDALLAELAQVAELVERTPELASFLASPVVDAAARREVLEKTLRGRASDLLVDALQVVNRHGRLGLLPAIAAAYRAVERRRRGLVDARVVTAVPFTDEQRAGVTAAIAHYTGKRPDLTLDVDPAVLGGLVVEVEGKKMDTSLAGRLRSFARDLEERAARVVWGEGGGSGLSGLVQNDANEELR